MNTNDVARKEAALDTIKIALLRLASTTLQIHEVRKPATSAMPFLRILDGKIELNEKFLRRV